VKHVRLWILAVVLTASGSAETGTPLPVQEKLGVLFSPETLHTPLELDSSAVLVLPNFDVQNSRIDLTERDVLTQKELLARAKTRYLNPAYQKTMGQLSAALGMLANIPSIFYGWHPNDAEASVLFADDEKLRQIRESFDLIDVIKDTDPAAYKELAGSLNQTFGRRPPQAKRKTK
jgi:hypothetical protein